MGTDPSRLSDPPRLTALGVLRKIVGGPKLLLLAMVVWTIGGSILAVNVGDYFGQTWGGSVGIIIVPLGLVQMMRMTPRRQKRWYPTDLAFCDALTGGTRSMSARAAL